MSHQFSARSPFWQIMFMAHFFALILAPQFIKPAITANLQNASLPGYLLIILLSYVGFTIWYVVTVRAYNTTTPKGKRLSVFQIKPTEFIDDDERSVAITAEAARSVYAYHTIAWPLAIIAMLAVGSVPGCIAIVGLVLLGHYIVYWSNIRSLL